MKAFQTKSCSLHKYTDLEPQTQEQDSGTNHQYGISLKTYQAIRAAVAEEVAMRCLLFEESTRIMSSVYKIQGRQVMLSISRLETAAGPLNLFREQRDH